MSGLASAPALRREASRRLRDQAFLVLLAAATLLGLGLLAGILATVVWQGSGVISLEFLTAAPRDGGGAGGVLPQIIGTLILAGTAALVATPLSLGVALVRTEAYAGRRAGEALGGLLFLLNGAPSILFGVFGYVLLVKACGLGLSWLAGGLILALMIVPTVTVAVVEAIRRVPGERRESARALGLTRSHEVRAVVLPAAARGLVTGLLLGLARAAGETAPILFTAAVFAGVDWPEGIRNSPVVALPYHIMNLALDASSPARLAHARGAALVLVGLALLLSAAAFLSRRAAHEEGRG